MTKRLGFAKRHESGLWSGPVEPMSLVLLGCRVAGPAALTPPARRRAERALQAYGTGHYARLLVCGGKAWHGVRETDALCRFLHEHGVPEAALEREAWSRSTRQNAHYAAQLLLPRGLTRVGVVTCDFHMERALRCFRGAGFEPEPVPARSPAQPMRSELYRAARERLCLSLDTLMTRNFSSV